VWPGLDEFGAPELRKLLKISMLRMVQRFHAPRGKAGGAKRKCPVPTLKRLRLTEGGVGGSSNTLSPASSCVKSDNRHGLGKSRLAPRTSRRVRCVPLGIW
jgi:hypothetical protein